MDRQQASQDLELIARVLDETRRRVDPQMFHAIIWGAIVLVWYPLMNWFELRDDGRAELVIGVAAIGLGFVLSAWLGWREGRRPRLAAANTRFAQRIGAFTATIVGTGILLSIAIPTLVPAGARYVPHAWGLLYALMLMTLGVFYSREFFFCGLPCLVATLVALRWPAASGFILGPAMGIGCIVAGSIAERRVARMRRESPDPADGPADEAHEKA